MTFQRIIKRIKDSALDVDRDYDVVFGHATTAFMDGDQLFDISVALFEKYNSGKADKPDAQPNEGRHADKARDQVQGEGEEDLKNLEVLSQVASDLIKHSSPVYAVPLGEGGAGAGVPVVRAEIELSPLDKAARAFSKARTAVLKSRHRVKSAMDALHDADTALEMAKTKQDDVFKLHNAAVLASLTAAASAKTEQDLEKAEIAFADAHNDWLKAHFHFLDTQELLQKANDKLRADIEAETEAGKEHMEVGKDLRRKRNPA